MTSPRYESVALGNRTQTWYFPAGTDCLRCHTPGYGEVLGLRTRQLAGGKPSIVAQWNARGLFGEDIGDPSRFAAHPRLGDAQASTRDRARAYLDVNCAICHHKGGPAPGGIDMRVQIESGQMNLVDVRPDAPLGLPSERRIAPGDREHSSLWARMQATGHGRMPPIASLVVDEVALGVIGEWIEGLPPR